MQNYLEGQRIENVPGIDRRHAMTTTCIARRLLRVFGDIFLNLTYKTPLVMLRVLTGLTKSLLCNN